MTRYAGDGADFVASASRDLNPKRGYSAIVTYLSVSLMKVRASLLACTVTCLQGALLAVLVGLHRAKGSDFFYYFCASKLVADGHGGLIYDSRALGFLERSLLYPMLVPHGYLPNVYPPFFALALAPLAKLPFDVAYVIWLALNCCLFAESLRRLLMYGGFGSRARLTLLFAASVSLPVVVALLLGQVSFMLLALLTAALFSARAGHERLTGVVLAFTLVKPQFVLPLLMILMVRRRWQSLAAFSLTVVVMFAAPILVLGWRTDVSYVQTLAKAVKWGANVGGFAPRWNRSFGGFTQLLLPSPASTIVDAILVATTLLLVVVAARKSSRIDLPFSFSVVAALLVSQHVLIHDLTLLLIPAAAVWRYRLSANGTIALGVFAYSAMFVGFSTSVTHSVQLPTIAMCALAIWILIVILRTETSTRRASGPSPPFLEDRQRALSPVVP